MKYKSSILNVSFEDSCYVCDFVQEKDCNKETLLKVISLLDEKLFESERLVFILSETLGEDKGMNRREFLN